MSIDSNSHENFQRDTHDAFINNLSFESYSFSRSLACSKVPFDDDTERVRVPN
jgi:hypothetical protein